MIPIALPDGVEVLAGAMEIHPGPLIPFSDEALEFLEALGDALRADRVSASMPDVMTFAFWIRPANLKRLKRRIDNGEDRLGLGAVLHITPSNIPVTFAFSFAFGLLAGNAGIVRLPSRQWPQVTAMCDVLRHTFDSGRYEAVRQRTAWVRSAREDAVTASLSAN